MQASPTSTEELVVIGKIVSVYGVRGEVKVYSYTDPLDNLLDYSQWTLTRDGETRHVQLASGRLHGKVLTAKIQGLDDREEARSYAGFLISVPRRLLPELDEDEFYWHQLKGLKVINHEEKCLGKVDHLLETGANDVLVVRPCEGSLDDRERLLPYTAQCVQNVDLAAGVMQVEWDADF